jgi:arginase family enzyme
VYAGSWHEAAGPTQLELEVLAWFKGLAGLSALTSFFMHDVRERGIAAIVEETIRIVGDGPVFLTVDVDVLDPAFAPGTGTPGPGGMTSGELLGAVREVARRLELVGADVVEVIPTAVGSADVTALVADRIVREILNGIALRRRLH